MAQKFSDLSYWHDSVPGSLKPRPALESDIQADIAIVGAGYTGLWTAYYLKQYDPSLNIAIVESEIAGFGASGRNGGWCSGFLSGIDRWLDDARQREGAIRLQKLMFDTVREVGDVARRESIDCHFEQSGALEVAVIPAHLTRMREELLHLHDMGFTDQDYRLLSAQEVAAELKVDQALGGILMSHCAAIHPARLARGLAETIENQGVALYEQSPARHIDGGCVRTTQGSISAPIIVLATEGYSNSLPGWQRQLIPLHSMMVATEPLSREQLEEINFQKRFTFGNGDRVTTYGQFTLDGRIAFGCRGTYHFGSAVQQRFDADDREFDRVRNTLIRFFPSLEGIRFTHAWGGTMGVSRSMRPSVNFDPAQGLGWAGGFFGNGVGATHLAGKTMADLVLSRDTERLHTPWVNSSITPAKWEPEPLRWLGIKSARVLMHMADKAEYRNSPLTPLITKTLDALLP